MPNMSVSPRDGVGGECQGIWLLTIMEWKGCSHRMLVSISETNSVAGAPSMTVELVSPPWRSTTMTQPSTKSSTSSSHRWDQD